MNGDDMAASIECDLVQYFTHIATISSSEKRAGFPTRSVDFPYFTGSDISEIQTLPVGRIARPRSEAALANIAKALKLQRMMIALLDLIAFLGGVAGCVANGIATYHIAKRTRRNVWFWTLAAVAPGPNVVTSFYFYATTLLRMLDELDALKTDLTFGPPSAKLGDLG